MGLVSTRVGQGIVPKGRFYLGYLQCAISLYLQQWTHGRSQYERMEVLYRYLQVRAMYSLMSAPFLSPYAQGDSAYLVKGNTRYLHSSTELSTAICDH